MAIEPDPIDEQASRESTDWLILLQEEPDDPELRRAFDDWLCRTPANAAAWARTQQVSGLIAATVPAHADRRSAPAAARPPAPAVPTRRRRGLRLAAVALAACLALFLLPGALRHLEADYITGTGEIRTVRLDDGSTVVMAPDSAIAVAYRGAERGVRLLAGEAFFEVAPDAGRPFRVAVRGVDTTVLGTGFDVRRGNEGATVAVQHGVVRVDYEAASPPVSERLEAGQSVRVSWSGRAERGQAAATAIASWRQRQLIAQDQPMHRVVDRLRPYYAGTIILADGALADRPVTGVYNLADPVDALRAIARPHGGTVRRITPWILVVSGP